jgi:amyloid beta precursor protein binding protein 1
MPTLLPGTPLDIAGLGVGMGGCDVAEDVARLKGIANGILGEIAVGSLSVLDDLTVEMVRCGGGELHAVASVVGGVGSQEVIKLVTQWGPCTR